MRSMPPAQLIRLFTPFTEAWKSKTLPLYVYITLLLLVRHLYSSWMYASAWDKGNLKTCSSPRMSTRESSGRAAVFLVETSDQKSPELTSLGRRRHPFKEPPSGHIPRNTRVVLAAVDMLQPYVCLSDEVHIRRSSSSSLRREEGEEDSHPPVVEMKLKWYVGGGSKVDSAFASWHPPLASARDLMSAGADWGGLLHLFTKHNSSSDGATTIRFDVGDGKGRWSQSEPLDPHAISTALRVQSLPSSSRNSTSYGSMKSAEGVTFLSPGVHWLVLWAKVDSDWGKADQGDPKGPPQTHLARARTEDGWREDAKERERSGREIYSSVFWPSDPIVVKVDSEGTITILSQVQYKLVAKDVYEREVSHFFWI